MFRFDYERGRYYKKRPYLVMAYQVGEDTEITTGMSAKGGNYIVMSPLGEITVMAQDEFERVFVLAVP